MPTPTANKVLLVGWDAADWKIINPLMDAGQMPAVQSLVEGGVSGYLSRDSINKGNRSFLHRCRNS